MSDRGGYDREDFIRETGFDPLTYEESHKRGVRHLHSHEEGGTSMELGFTAQCPSAFCRAMADARVIVYDEETRTDA